MTDSTSFLPSDQPTSTLDARADGARVVRPAGRRFERGDSVSRFTVLDHLGTGGMGQVYAAYDPRLDRKIALKILRPFRASVGRESRARLLREARALARLNDPNVLTLFDVGTFGDQIFLATEFVPGVHLGRWLRDGSRSVDEILDVFRQAGRGLMAAHGAGLVHRDFKLGNVMVRPDGRALVLDFGLARHGGTDGVDPSFDKTRDPGSGDRLDGDLTRVGARLGTPRFMAPEQWAGEPAGPAADQFSFCVSLYEALYGEPPFEPSRRRHEPPDWTAEPSPASISSSGQAVPARVRKILLRGLAVDPADRFPTMRQLLDPLAADPGRRWRRIAALIGTIALVGTALWRPWESAPQPCRGGEARLATAWGDEQRGRLDAALTETGVPWATAAARSTVGRLDTYAESWLDMYRDACESTHVRGEQSAELLDRRMACLDHRRRQLDALVRLVIAEPAALVDGVVAAVDRLPGLEPCADTAALLAVLEPPADPATRRAIDGLRERLAEVEALL
ncbi:MAG: serine/threonine-protein kinase, partial [Acidobacteriota bacterium]